MTDCTRLYELRVRRVARTLRASEPGAGKLGAQITSSTEAWRLFAAISHEEAREIFMVAVLDVRNRLIGYEVTSVGTVTGVEVHPREVFRGAILTGAAAVIVGHNHPSGDPTPSRDDLCLTMRIRDAGELLGIPLLDHVVVASAAYGGAGGYVSMAERYGLEQLGSVQL